MRQSVSCDVPVGLQDAPSGSSSGAGTGEGQADGNKATTAGAKMPIGGSSDRSSTASAPTGYNGLADALSDGGGGLAPPNLPPPPPPSYTDSSDSSDDDRPLIGNFLFF